MKKYITSILVMHLIVSSVLAGSIQGYVCDSHGNPLVGATVIIAGTVYGAMTDANGEYSIINLEAGTYSLQASMVGLCPRIIEGIRVTENRTTTCNLVVSGRVLNRKNTVEVHEWGAVTFSQESVIFGADPETDPFSEAIPTDQLEEPLARAPVVYFYGEPFSGVFTVTVNSGSFIELYPEPDTIVDTSPMTEYPSGNASWNITSAIQAPSNLREMSFMLPTSAFSSSCVSGEQTVIWRKPPSMHLELSDGYREKFIYYECRLNSQSDSAYYPVLMTDDGPTLDSEWDSNTLRAVMSEDSVMLELVSSEGTGAVEFTEVPEILFDWAGKYMKSVELQAMWETWEDWVLGGEWSGDTLVVFPLPSSTVEGISSIYLETDNDIYVEYRRFFLGIFSM